MMELEEQKQYTSQEENVNQITLRDILNIFWINRMWFILSIIVCLAIACLYILRTPKTYSRSATVLVKEQKKGGMSGSSAAMFQDIGMFNFNNDVNNELIVFQATKLMRNVVNKLNLTVDYVAKSGLKKLNLYTESPFQIYFLDAGPDMSFSFEAKKINASTIRISDFYQKPDKMNILHAPAMNVRTYDTVNSPVGRIVVIPTEEFVDKKSSGKLIYVYKKNFDRTVIGYQQKVSVSLANKQASILYLSINDVSIKRAEDVLNALIDAYNEDALADKNKVSLNTSNFINDRLSVIDKELGNVDSDIASFKSSNKLTDVQTETGGYVQEGNEYKKTSLGIENQLSMARYIQDYLANSRNRNALIPANVGFDQALEQQISTYNTTMLQRDKLMAGSSMSNPLVANLTAQLIPMRHSIVQSVNNLVSSL